MAIPQWQVDNWFTYHAPTPEQLTAYNEIRSAAKIYAETVNKFVPDCADKTAAIRKIRDSVMAANLAVACYVPDPAPATPKNTVTQVLLGLALCALLLPLGLSGCATAKASPPTAPAVTALNILNEVQSDVAALQQAESSAYTAGLIDAPTNAAIQKALAQEAVDATALSQAIASTTSTTATVQQKVDALIADLQTDIANGVAGIKDAKTKATIIASLAATEIVVNGIMAAYGGK